MARPKTIIPISNKQIALLHVAKRELGLTEEDDRAILARYGGCESASDLEAFGFQNVMKYMTALGFRSNWTKRTFGARPAMATPAQVDLIRRLWRQFSGKDDAGDMELNKWLNRFHKVSALRFVNDRKAAKAISALKAMVARQVK
ncbi:regulatory protein GemA [Pararhizobium antarcticum]|uniref:GemA protein n=1 Tax=Pararhizobium antarcticum TaxID=1798805 RepID=A0A657LWH6_9HYPH|nr:regulatory protein GemA [Pararhizobium antarcticum]OJF99974.1 hypothetical protein AX760_11355 [Pararhizobium antarcticum]